MSNFEAFKSWQFWWGHSFRVLQPCMYHVIFNILCLEGEYARFICARYKAFFSSLPTPYLIITIGSNWSHPVSNCKPLKPFHVSYLEFWCKSYNTSNCRLTLWFHDTYPTHIVSHNINRSPMFVHNLILMRVVHVHCWDIHNNSRCYQTCALIALLFATITCPLHLWNQYELQSIFIY